jgi:DNA-binding LacI/PurR family transcriptional regulator
MNHCVPPRTRETRLEDVAKACGVSYQTVSRVVNNSPAVADKTRRKVLHAIAELGYRPNLTARRLATRRASLIGMVGSNITYYGPAQVMVSIEETAKRAGYNLMFARVQQPSRAELTAAITDLCAHQVDGLVLGVPTEGKIDLVRKLCRQTPFVTLDAVVAPDVPSLIVDQKHGVQLSVRHLLELGHQRVACISGPPNWPPSGERRYAWEQTLRKAGLEPGPCIEGDWSAESGYLAAKSLLDLGRQNFTAIVAANDQMALGALRALHDHGVDVPDDVSVVGYDNLPEARYFSPPLTTVRHDFAGQGERCIAALLRMINGEPIDLPIPWLRPELAVRESTAAPPFLTNLER